MAILDADKEGYLRSHRSLIQTAGRAARNLDGRVIFYGDTITDSMRRAMDETARRRHIQEAYHEAQGITPERIKKQSPLLAYATGGGKPGPRELAAESVGDYATTGDTEQLIRRLEVEMKAAAKKLEFERAAELRNRIRTLRLKALELAQ